jgi:hypothetical protein
MTENEIDKLVSDSNWATIITVNPDGSPYAIEATPFDLEGEVCFMINPNGTTKKNIENSKAVLLKYTLAGKDLTVWAGVSLMGTGGFVHDPERISKGWDRLGKVMGADYSEVSLKFVKNPERSPLFAVKVREKTGRCSAKAGEAFEY